MKKRFIPLFLLVLPLMLASMQVSAQGYGPGSPGYAAEKASHISSTPSAPYVRPSVAGLSWADGCYINWDASYSSLAANDDGSTELISLPFTFTLYGTSYTSLYVNNNGNITFGSAASTYTSSGFPIFTPMVAPFWADVMTTTGAVLRYKVFDHKFIATWSNVGYYSAHYDQTDSFQVVITDGTDASIGLGNNVAFHYAQMNWTTGDASGGSGGFGGTPATVGINAGDGTHYVQVGRFGANSSSYTGSSSEISNGVHYLEYQCFAFNVSGSGNIPPSVSGLPSGNIDTIECGLTHTYLANWIGPETDQVDSSSVDTGDVCHMMVHQSMGFSSVSRDTISVTGGSCNMGTHHFYVTGYDNVGGTTTDTVTIVVVPFRPHASSNSPLCAGGMLNLMSAAGGMGATYSWTGPGGFTSSMQNPMIDSAEPGRSGMYYVTVTSPGGCTSMDSVMVTVNSLPTASITASGPLSFCEGGSVVLTVSGGTSRLWSTSATTSSITVTESGTFYAAVSDDNGCVAYAGPVTVTVNPMPGAITSSMTVCSGSTITLTDATSGGMWMADSSGSSVVSVSGSGSVMGISAGTATVTYMLSTGCYTTGVLTVNATPEITGATAICIGHTSALTASLSGGTWSSSVTSGVATVSSAGVVSGMSVGSAFITYTMPSGCFAAALVSVTPSVSISATSSSVCTGSSLMLTATGSGSWSSSNTSIATVNSDGVVTGVATGSVTISYSAAGGCSATTTINVLANPAAIAGTTSICAGASAILTDASAPGISWTSSNTSVATVGSLSGSVSGVSAGTSIITFTASNGCRATTVVTINAPAGTISGSSTVCAGSSITLTNTSSGTWSSSAPGAATVVSSTGIVTGVAAGTTNITFTTGAGCTATRTVTVLAQPAAITGSTSLCVGATSTLSTTSTGGSWSSGDNMIATVSGSGLVTAVAAGSVSISYTGTNGCSRVAAVTVGAGVPAISGNTNVCVGIPSTLTDSTSGGTWSSSSTTIATINSTTGVVTGITTGSLFITYSLGGGCYNTVMITVNPTPAAIGGATSVCVGATTTLTEGTTGGSWSSSNTSMATVDGSGVVTGMAAGTVSISYTVGTGCYAVKSITVKAIPAAIAGTMSVCVGATTALTDPTTPGSGWSSGSTAVATVNSGSGVVTGVSAGTVNITYTLSTGCYTTTIVTVNPLPSAISGNTPVCVATTITLSATSSSGGSWSSGTPTKASIGASTGVVTGVSAGTSRITFTSGLGCRSTTIVTVLAQPAAIGGTKTICLGSTSALTSSPAGGTWSSSDDMTASVGSSGIVTGVNTGTAIISYTNAAGCSNTAVVTVNAGVPDIMGANTVCVGKTTALSDSTTGGTWSSSSTATATVTSAGVVTGVASGTVNITYTLTAGCRDIKTMTVNPAAATITGTTTVCVGSAITLSTTNTDGSWSSSNTGMATVDADGVVAGVAAGTINISYILPTGCYAIKSITVKPLPAAIGGPTSVCVGSPITLTDATTGGQSWVSGTTSVATIGSLNGVVTGVSEGTSIITYTLSTGCSVSTVITVNPLPSSISGGSSVCIGGTATLAATSTSGGSWSSSNTGRATVGSSTGVVTGVATGSVTITFTSGAGCRSTLIMTVIALPNAITGSMTVCAGSTTTLSNTTTGGTWSSDDDMTATVSGSGVVTGVATGTVTITYTSASGCYRTAIVTVNTGISSITGSSEVCVGKTTTLSDATTGGTWSSSATTKATVSSAGVVTGVAAGTLNITYTVSAGCNSIWAMTVDPAVGAISGANVVCANASITLSTASTGGSWSSDNTGLATVDSSGVVTGVSAGTVHISYMLPTGCYATYSVLVRPLPAAIAGTTSICIGGTATLTDPTTGGVSWASSDPSVATIGSASGILTGVNTGTTTITYTISTGCSITTIVTVNSGASIMGTTSVCAGSTTSLSATLSGGTWSSSNATVASVTSTGLVTGNTAGTATITYSLGSACYTTAMVTVNAVPNTITGITTICMGSTSALNSTTSGGSWSSDNDAVASVGTSGVVIGNTTGTATISYTSAVGCSRSVIVTVTAAVADISGSSSPCVGVATTMTDATTGGTWSSSNTSVATIVSSTGVLTGIASGTTNITYAVTPGCRSITTVTVGSGAGTISGPASVCAGSMISLSTTGAGGTWSTGNAGIATVDASGNATGVSAGSVSISYMLSSGCMSTYSITVKPVPSAISGATSLCVGGTATLTDATTGGVSWISSDSTIASIGSASGVLTAMGAGMATITYTIINGCYATTVVTISSLPSAITGSLEICQGTSAMLSSATSGGSWSSSGSSVATVGTAGDVVGVAGGTSTISYSLGGSCVVTAIVTIDPLPAAILGGSTVCQGSTITLTDATSGGSWTSTNSTIATVSGSGVVTGMSTGTVNISYTLSTGCGRAASITVVAPASAITGSTTICVGNMATLSNTTGGGTWSSSNTAVAAIGSTTGIVTGASTGTTSITYTAAPGCVSVTTVTVNTALPANTGTAVVTVGASTTLSNSVTGGTWVSSNSSAATVAASGVVTGVATGNPVISYILGGCYSNTTMTVNPAISPIAGSLTVCEGASTTLTDATPGGLMWVSSIPSVATIGSISGVVTGVAAGTTTISYVTISGTIVTAILTVNATPPAITGPATVCVGSTITKANTITGGTWSTSSTTFGTIDATSGVVTGIFAGTTVVTYNAGGCVKTAMITVNATPAAITGYANVCTGTSANFTTTSTGGTWSSSDAAIATVGSSTGAVTGVSSGTINISYTFSTGCARTYAVTVAAPTANGGGSNLCKSASVTLTNATTGGTWSTSNPSIATVGATTGIANGVATGTVNITYTISPSCKVVTHATVNPAVGAITGTASVCLGFNTTLADTSVGGSWVSSNPSLGSVSTGGVVTGVSVGTPVISYVMSSGCYKSVSVPVKALPAAITGNSISCTGGTTSLADASSPGGWSSSTPAVGSIGATSGVVAGITTGTTVITFTATSTGCYTTRIQTVNTAGSISGTTTVSIAASAITPVLLSDAVTGGTWSSSNVSRATIDAGGNVTGHVAGGLTISYSVNGCVATYGITVVSPRPGGNGATPAESFNELQLFPNPTSGALSIRSAIAGTFMVYAIDGKVVGRYDVVAGQTDITLPKDLASGNYVCRFSGADGSKATIQLAYKQ